MNEVAILNLMLETDVGRFWQENISSKGNRIQKYGLHTVYSLGSNITFWKSTPNSEVELAR